MTMRASDHHLGSRRMSNKGLTENVTRMAVVLTIAMGAITTVELVRLMTPAPNRRPDVVGKQLT